MTDVRHSTRARLKRLGRRLGALPATAVILLLIAPVWIGYNGLEYVIAPVGMIAMQAVALHGLLRGYRHRVVASLLAMVLTFPLAFVIFSLITHLAGGESFEAHRAGRPGGG